jgi:hypothetical protein
MKIEYHMENVNKTSVEVPSLGFAMLCPSVCFIASCTRPEIGRRIWDPRVAKSQAKAPDVDTSQAARNCRRPPGSLVSDLVQASWPIFP